MATNCYSDFRGLRADRAATLAGLESGARLGRRAAERGQVIGGVILAGVRLAVGFGALG